MPRANSHALRTLALLLCGLLPVLAADGPRFLPRDPVWADPDRISIPEPRKIELSKGYDLLETTYFNRGGKRGERAQNINTLGEVPDSSWFENRMSLRPMTTEALVRGPDRSSGPDLSKPLTITSLKTEGITPGFTVKDAAGRTFIVKVDPLSRPQLTTSAEIIGTKFFYAFGYHVPENYLAYIKREQLAVGAEAKFTDKEGKKRALRERDIDEILKLVPQRPDGRMQVMASLFVPGKPIGRFKYYGTRTDDANDIFAHENRRELRGLRVFDSWLNHNDSDAVNSLDAYVTEGENKYIRHYLIDFGTVLGSGAFEPKSLRAGNEYYIELGPALRSAVTLGLWDRSWRTIDYPDFPAIGRFEADYFEAAEWKPDYPNPAHDRMLPEDGFWAARTVARFTDEMVRAVVMTGKYDDPAASEYLIKTLIKRRDKIVRYYLGLVNPLDEFRSAGGTLSFRNLGADHGLATPESYQYQWFRFDNSTGKLDAIGDARSVRDPAIPITTDSSPYLMVRIHTLSASVPGWKKNVDVYLRGAERTVVGIEHAN